MSTAGMPSAAPHCAMHVSREMELREMGAPAWLAKPDGAEETGEADHTGGVLHKRYIRKFWKCPVAGCSRVAAYLPTEEEEKTAAARECPHCGEPTRSGHQVLEDGKRHRACKKCGAAIEKQ